MFDDTVLDEIYEKKTAYTIYNLVRPISQGKGFSRTHNYRASRSFGVDVLLGDPRFALFEDVLGADWNASGVRGLRTSFIFRQFLQTCQDYDYVFFDMGPSLGSINRAVLIGCDYFILPLSIDVFSIRATENISTWLREWKKRLSVNVDALSDPGDLEVDDISWRLRLVGYVSQQYIAKRDSTGERRAVKAYERIMQTIPEAIGRGIIDQDDDAPTNIDYRLGSIPNLHSLVPMSQTSRKPIFSLRGPDGIVGAHFAKVNDALEIYRGIAERFEENIGSFDD
jgi:cellulose biosynthesis protein BcsQ